MTNLNNEKEFTFIKEKVYNVIENTYRLITNLFKEKVSKMFNSFEAFDSLRKSRNTS